MAKGNLDSSLNKSLQMAFPPVLTKLMAELMEPQPSFAAITESLSMDPMLTARILQIVNSPAYGFGQRISDIKRATIALGTQEIFRLTVTLVLQKQLQPVKPRAPEALRGDWRLTVWSAIAADALAKLACPNLCPQAYLAALLKDLPLLLAFCQQETPPFLTYDRMCLIPSREQFAEERKWWGRTHPEIAQDIALLWGFPISMSNAVGLHHNFEDGKALDPLDKCVAFATRWAEILQAPEQDSGKLISFEMSLAAAFSVSPEDIEKLRGSCAVRFNSMLSELNIGQATSGLRMHELSLESIQNYHFLALEAFSEANTGSLDDIAAKLKTQIHLFWDLLDWDLCLFPEENKNGTLYRCRNGVLSPKQQTAQRKPLDKAGWRFLPLSGSWCATNSGYLGFRETEDPEHTCEKLSPFLNLFGLHLKKFFMEAKEQSNMRSVADSPLPIARLNSAFVIKELSQPFLQVLGLGSLAPESPIAGVLHDCAGVSHQFWHEYIGSQTQEPGKMFKAAGGRLQGRSFFVSLSAPDQMGDRLLFLSRFVNKNNLSDGPRTDELTGLPSLSLFHQILNHECAQAQKENKTIGLAYTDLKGFSHINERFGFAAGDALLVRIAALFRSIALKHKAVPCRYQGDTFAVLLVDADKESLENLMRELHEQISIACHDTVSTVTAMGLTSPDAPVPAFLSKLRRTCNEAKETGKAIFWVT